MSELTALVKQHNLKADATRKLIQDYLDFEKEPLRDEIIETMKDRPALMERSGKAEEMWGVIKGFIDRSKGI